MNGKQRVMTAFAGKATDRRAVSLTLSLYGARLTNCPLDEYYSDPVKYLDGQNAVMEAFGPDVLFAPIMLAAEGEAFGGEMRYLPAQAPNLVRPVIHSASEIGQIEKPDVDSHPSLVFIRESLRRMKSAHGDHAAIACVTLTPTEMPALIMGLDGWLNTFLFDEEGRRRMLEISTAFFQDWTNALFADGADLLVLPISFVSSSVLPRNLVEREVVPVWRECFSQVQGPLVLHHGANPMLPFCDLFADMPNVAACLVDPRDDLGQMRKILGEEKMLLGGVDGPTLDKRSPESIRRACCRHLKDRAADPRFMLATTAADVDYYTPPENIQAIMDAAIKYGEEMRAE